MIETAFQHLISCGICPHNMTHIPYKAAAQAQADVIGGQVPVMFVVAAAAIPQIQAGRLRALGVTTLERLAQIPEVPTIDEAGIKGFEVISWIGIAGPAGLPPDIVSKSDYQLNQALNLLKGLQIIGKR